MSATGEPAVDEVLEGLGELDDLPPADHVERYEEIHRRLQQVLTGADDGDPSSEGAG